LLGHHGDHTDLADAQSFAACLAPPRKAEWVVYSKRPFGGPEASQIVRQLTEFDATRRSFVSRFTVAQLVASARSKSASSPAALKSP
jgi:hypothetical protein